MNPSEDPDLDSEFLPDDSSDQPADEPKLKRHSPEFKALQQRVVDHVSAANYRPVKPKAISKKLGLVEPEKSALRRAIRLLTKSGRIRYSQNHVVHPAPLVERAHAQDKLNANEKTFKAPEVSLQRTPRGEKGLVVGIFRRAAAGFGFVRPAGTAKSEGRDSDIFIPKQRVRDAADGDKVAVRISRSDRRDDGKISGEIVEILERGTSRFVGTYEDRYGTGYVQIDGKVFAEPIDVGDATAKNARSGDKVVIEMVRYPSHAHGGEGVIVEVLGPRGTPGVDTLSIIREFELPEEFPDEVLADARVQADRFNESIEGRADYTQDTVVTIDPVDARDFDDAISIARLASGNWQLSVHIADVSHFVPLRSKLDAEARDRATSIYLPDRVIPMLPEIISNHLASLQPNKIRYTQTCIIEFSPEGTPLHAEVHSGAICSKRRFTYEEVDEFLADRETWRENLKPEVWELLGRMHELAMILRKRRMERGAIELTLPEVKIDLDNEGKVAGAHLVKHTESHQIIEEFMLAANEAVARILAAEKLNFLRRVHESPDLRKLNTLTGFVRELGIECEGLESRFEIKRVIAAVAGSAREHAVNYAVLRSMQKAVYSPMDEGHYALHSEKYCHFTSPIRRYPDLTVHRMLTALEAGKRPHDEYSAMALLGEHCSEREQRAEKAERELIKVKLLTHLADRVGEKLTGVVTGVEDFGFFVQGTELPAEGLVRVQTLGDDHFRYDRATHSLVGHRAGNDFCLGDIVQVEIARVDVDRRELDFRLIKKISGGKPIRLPSETGGEDRSERRKRGGSKSGSDSRPRGRAASDHASPSRKPAKKNRKGRTDSSAPEGKSRIAPKKKQRPGKRERANRKKKSD